MTPLKLGALDDVNGISRRSYTGCSNDRYHIRVHVYVSNRSSL